MSHTIQYYSAILVFAFMYLNLYLWGGKKKETITIPKEKYTILKMFDTISVTV